MLDDEVIGNLIDQQGDDAAVEIIATFLPRVVVDSLIKALHRADLELEALTLEPIAAIDVLVPPSMRRLNVALVDVGAGTSDIAITDSGTVIAYGMVSAAGDEVTEALAIISCLISRKRNWQKESFGQTIPYLLQTFLDFKQFFQRKKLLITLPLPLISLQEQSAVK